MNIFSNFFKVIFYCFIIAGIAGGNVFLYKTFLENHSDKFIDKKKLITIDIEQLKQAEQKLLIAKYKTALLKKYSNKNIINIPPDKLIDDTTNLKSVASCDWWLKYNFIALLRVSTLLLTGISVKLKYSLKIG